MGDLNRPNSEESAAVFDPAWDELPMEQLREFDSACDRFEQAYARDRASRIEEFIPDVPSPQRKLIVFELVRLEAELRHAGAERLTPDEYATRFPLWADELRSLIDRLNSANLEELAARAGAETWQEGRLPLAETHSRPNWRADTASRVSSSGSWEDVPADGVLGHYRLGSVIGHGGMGIVVRAHDSRLGRDVALKLLSIEACRQPNAKERFVREAQAAAVIRHVNVVTIHSVEEFNGIPFMVMELVGGRTLDEYLREHGRLTAAEVASIATQIADGLAAAHKRGLAHRDVKPGNILLENENQENSLQLSVKITDFGLARAIDEVSLTYPGLIVGTPQYMSPEQANGQTVDHRSDLFSLGSLMYAMGTGRVAFQAESVPVVLRQICDQPATAIPEINPEIPKWLVAIIDKLMAKSPDDRYQSAAEVSELLRRGLRGELDPPATAIPTLTRRPHSRRSRLFATIATAGLLLAGAFSIRTSDGQFELTIDDPQIAASLGKSGSIVVEDRLTKRQFTLRRGSNRLPGGNYDLRVNAPDGLELSRSQFRIKYGDNVSATVIARVVRLPEETNAIVPASSETALEQPEVFELSPQILGKAAVGQAMAADFDGDGDMDLMLCQLATPAARHGRITLFVNDGAAQFSEQLIFDDGVGGLGTAGDLDGDSDPDVFVTSPSAKNAILFNEGQGQFRREPLELNGPQRSAALGDVDDDGDLDVVLSYIDLVHRNQPFPIQIWLNDGQGRFTDSGQRLGDTVTRHTALADVDGDEDLDLFQVAMSASPSGLWLNDGKGQFTDSSQRLGSGSAKCAALVDLDADGDRDVYLAGDEAGTGAVYVNDGQGNFTDSSQRLNNQNGGGVALADFDGDGDVDTLDVTDRGQPDVLWLNDGQGRFMAGPRIGASWGTDVAAADFDGDTDVDFFVPVYRTGPNELWINQHIPAPIARGH